MITTGTKTKTLRLSSRTEGRREYVNDFRAEKMTSAVAKPYSLARPEDSHQSHPDSEPFVFNESHHSAHLLAGLRNLRDSSQLFDVTLIAEGQEFPAHRVVLASCSDYFHAMFTNGLRESFEDSIVLSGVTANALKELIHFAYTSELKITKDNVVAVLSSASHVQILPAVRACETYLSSHLCLDNCVELEHIADIYCLTKLQRRVHCFMCQHWASFIHTTTFLTLSIDQLENILQSDFPVYCAEIEVVKGLLMWISHDLAVRSSSLPVLFGLVRCDNLQTKEIECALATFEAVLNHCPSLSSRLKEMTSVSQIKVPGVVNTRGYFETLLLAGGFQHYMSHTYMSNDILYLDPDTQKPVVYTTIPHMNQADFGLEVLDNMVYVVGGCCNEDFTDVTHPYSFCFNPTTTKWTSLPPMSQERCRFCLGVLNGLLYAIGGEVDNSQLLATCEMFDPKQAVWSPIAPLPAIRSELAGTSLGGKLYVSGGTQEQLDQVQNQMWCYTPDSDCWTSCAPMLSARADHTMLTFRGNIYVIGGWCKTDQGRSPVTSIDRYNVDSNRWETVQHMKRPRKYGSCTLFQGRVYVIGGGWDCANTIPMEKNREVDVLDMESMQWLPSPVSLPLIWEHSTVPIYLPRKA